jgi:DNA-binding transcriptional LysR family regulator
MEIQQIRYFLAVADTLNFTRAAERLGVSQPAITNGIKRLEAEFNAPLFHRQGKRMLLSDLGALMQPQLQKLVDQTTAAEEVAKNFLLLKDVPLRVGIMSTIGAARFSDLLARYQRENPGVELALIEGSFDELTSCFDTNELDLAILSSPDPLEERFTTVDLYEERYVVIFRKGHRFEQLPSITLKDVCGEAYVDRLACEMREMVMAVCNDLEVDLYARFRSMREDWIQAMVLAGMGFAFMPEFSVTQSELLSRALIEPSVSRTVKLARIPGRTLSPAGRTFINALENEFRN